MSKVVSGLSPNKAEMFWLRTEQYEYENWALKVAFLILQVLPQPAPFCKREDEMWPDEVTSIAVTPATSNCFAL
ncbi:uncharacterized [Tachysurus ichikawai]